MKKVIVLAGLLLCMSAGVLRAQEKIVVGGAGGIRVEIVEAAKAYMAKHPSDLVQVLDDAMSTTGGIEATKAGRLTIGLVTRPPRDHEKGRLVYRPIALSPVGVGVHNSMPISNLSEAQVCDIFSGKIRSWREVGGSDGRIVVLTRKGGDDANTKTIREKIECFRDLTVGPEAIVLVRGGEVLDALNGRPGTIGIVSLPPNRPNIKPVAIGGVMPSAETMQSGKYKFTNENGVVTLGEPQGLAKRFLEFLAGPEAQKLFAQYWVAAVR